MTCSKIKVFSVFDNLPDPEVIAEEIAENLEAALENFRNVMNGLDTKGS